MLVNIIFICTLCETVQKSSPDPLFFLFLKLVQINYIMAGHVRIFLIDTRYIRHSVRGQWRIGALTTNDLNFMN